MADIEECSLTPIDWATVMRDHYPTASRVIDRLMPRGLRNKFDPEDFVGEAIVELMSNPVFSMERGPALLILIAKRRMIDAARSPRSRPVAAQIDLIDQHPSVALELEASEQREAILKRVGKPRHRAAVELRCQGYTLPEIAALTGVRLRTVQRFFKQFTAANEPY